MPEFTNKFISQRPRISINKDVSSILGLDPARPLVSNYGSKLFRLGRDDAHVVHVIHTNAGFLGETGLVGHADFCINGGRTQPGCKGHFMPDNAAPDPYWTSVQGLRSQEPNSGIEILWKGIARCSHFQSSCYFAASVRHRLKLVAVPCDSTCPKVHRWGIRFDRRSIRLAEETPDSACVVQIISSEFTLQTQLKLSGTPRGS
ncbi:Pancreatic triacylglycerol lipase [Eumeta japonica]|uniref:Pancreatic triacylglycerol lipase n=1 Tax=Eumeta variegata TaxID=151549 RepID=A0A4C1YS23_EUMVA|nr:Pancreatic triacylglycerol lipase [Eumeta japonica]